jgi:hypothetical protein
MNSANRMPARAWRAVALVGLLLCAVPTLTVAQGLPEPTASPLLNWFGGVAIVIAGVIAAVVGTRNKGAAQTPAAIPENTVHLSGPIAEVLRHLEDIARSLRHIEKGQDDAREALERGAREAEIHRSVIANNSNVLRDILTTVQFILNQKTGPRR